MEEKQKQAELAKAKQAKERKTADSKSEAVKPAEVNVVESKPATQSTLIESPNCRKQNH